MTEAATIKKVHSQEEQFSPETAILSHRLVTGSESQGEENHATALESWRPRRDLNPCYRRERAVS